MAYLSRLRTRRYTPPAAFRRWKTTLVRLSVYCPSVCRRARARARTHIYIHTHTHKYTTYIHTYVVRSRDFHWRWLLRLAVAARIIEVQACPAGSNHSAHIQDLCTHLYAHIYVYTRLPHSFNHANDSLARSSASSPSPPLRGELLLLLLLRSVLAYPVPSRSSTVKEKEEEAATIPRYTTLPLFPRK